MCDFLVLTAIFLQFTSVLCQENSDTTTPVTTPSIIALTDDNPSIIWKASDDSSIKITAEKGYQIQVNITEIDVDGENGDYVTVKIDRDDDYEEDDSDDALMFTYTVTGQPSYLYNHNEIRADYIIGGGDTSTNTFEIKFTRVGEPITTTEPPTTITTDAMPTASPEEPDSLNVYIKNKAASAYGDAEQQAVRKAIASMGIDYCNDENCPLEEDITSNNVRIILLQQCPLYWENFDSCANLTFRLPIVKLNNTNEMADWKGYQLSRYHLQAMWTAYAEKHLNPLGLDIYEEPDVNKMFSRRLIVLCVVIVSLVALILIFRAIINKINRKRRRHSDAMSIIRQSSSRTSQLSLPPHYLQEVPPLFSSDFPLYPDQKGLKQPYTDFKTSLTEDPVTPVVSNLVNISNADENELEDADA